MIVVYTLWGRHRCDEVWEPINEGYTPTAWDWPLRVKWPFRLCTVSIRAKEDAP